MAFWGPDANERFQFGGVNPIPTADFDDVMKAAGIIRNDQLVLFIQYDKGTEDGIQLRIDFSTPEDTPEAPTTFFEIVKLSLVTQEATVLEPLFSSTGLYRFPVPVAISERIFRVSIKSQGGVFTGTGEVWFATGNMTTPLPPVTVP